MTLFSKIGIKIKNVTKYAAISQLLNNSIWLFSGSAASALISFFQGIIVARVLGVEQFGLLGLIISFGSVTGQVFDSRSWETSIKFLKINPRE